MHYDRADHKVNKHNIAFPYTGILYLGKYTITTEGNKMFNLFTRIGMSSSLHSHPVLILRPFLFVFVFVFFFLRPFLKTIQMKTNNSANIS